MPDDLEGQELRVQLPRPTCAYCKSPVEIHEEKAACTACMSWSHAECVNSHGACPACGAGAPPRTAPSGLKQAAPPPRQAEEATETPELELAPQPQRPASGAPLSELLFLVFVGCVFFALSLLSLGAVIGGLGRALGFFGGVGAKGAIVACGALASLFTTPLFVIRVAMWLERRRSRAGPGGGASGPE